MASGGGSRTASTASAKGTTPGSKARDPVAPTPAPTVLAPTPVAPTPAPTAAPTPEPPRLGKLVLAPGWDEAMAVSVAGRRVRLDREQTLELKPGSYDVEYTLETPAYSIAQTARVEVSAGGTARLETPLQRPGRLTVQPHLNTRPGTVRLDGQILGPAPVRGHWLLPGDHLVEVFASNAADAEPPVRQTITVASDQETVVTFDVDGKVELQTRTRPLS
jgi:hypothetical protein